MSSQGMWSERYRAHLASDKWRHTRDVMLRRAGYCCQRCGVRGMRGKTIGTVVNLQVHHLTYVRLGNELLTDLIVLCHRCHDAAHEERRQRR